ncbi:dipeptidase [Microlunatus ginsengisoli]|uniref:M20/M25/M40 family metallo-hydrolase n=1 Tax=Microlunatus ginsengisoli TaxID=363863 RepID=A0ABP7A4C8_9ACTN
MTTIDPEQRIDDVLPGVLADLEQLVAIESVSADPARAGEVARSAEQVAERFRAAGCPDVRTVSAAAGAPAVIGRFPAPEGMPTVCLYAHHDVQPEGDPAQWTSPPYAPEERDGRLYGRGSGDDKGGIAVHLAALRAYDGHPPVGVTLFVEGEEEVGSPTLGALLAENRDALAADVFVIADSWNWGVGRPSFTTSLRGLVDCVVEVRTLDHGIHSGGFGGVVPDALTTLCRLLATLHDERGNVAVAGLATSEPPDLAYDEARLRAETGLLDGVDFIGDGSVVDRLWCKPAIAVIALDTTPIAQASNTIIPSARAKISLRLAPGDDAQRALARLTEHLESHASWGARVTVHPGDTGQPSRIAATGPIADVARAAFARAWGTEVVEMGQGGSIPMVAEFQQAFPAATVLVTAVCDPDSRMHGVDESVHLGDLRKAALAETLLLGGLAELADSR